MPELPEVETVRRILEPQLAGRRVETVEIRNPQIIAYPDAEQFAECLRNQTIAEMSRRGKFLTIHFAGGDRLCLHLRMTGQLLVMAEGTAVIQLEAGVDELIASVGKTLAELKEKMNGKEIGALHLVHCGGRRAGIDSRIDEVTKEIKSQVGDIPFITEFTFGEYGYEDDGRNTCGGLMLSFTAFGK